MLIKSRTIKLNNNFLSFILSIQHCTRPGHGVFIQSTSVLVASLGPYCKAGFENNEFSTLNCRKSIHTHCSKHEHEYNFYISKLGHFCLVANREYAEILFMRSKNFITDMLLFLHPSPVLFPKGKWTFVYHELGNRAIQTRGVNCPNTLLFQGVFSSEWEK